jgi:septum formation protein
MQTLVLASTSRFRKTVLEKLGVPFEVHAPQVDESIHHGETPSALVERLACDKAAAVASHYPNALIIGSDQVAVIDGQIVGKPGNHENAVIQLQRASGKTVTFYTGLCLLNTATTNVQSGVETFDVVFRLLSDQQIENYVREEKPYDSAGSFKSEGLGIALFERLQGDDPNALIGLPLIRLVRMLEAEGFNVI